MGKQVDLSKIIEYAVEKKIKIRNSEFMTNSIKLYLYNIYDDLIKFAEENAHGRSKRQTGNQCK